MMLGVSTHASKHMLAEHKRILRCTGSGQAPVSSGNSGIRHISPLLSGNDC